mgnify:CR=1 FL=1
MLEVKNISFSYGTLPVISNITFKADKGEHISIIGESGSGKSTLLKLLYGEYDLDQGEIYWNNQQILGPKFNLITGYDFMKHVTQEFDLMPFTTTEENIGKYLSNFYPRKKKRRTKELMELFDLLPYANTKVKYLSGGQKQRVALARALAKRPEIILLDEPFSHIDNFKKQGLRRRLFNFLKAHQITCIVATHDKEDVLGYADRILVLHDGKALTNQTPNDLYKNPKTPIAASFFGEFNTVDNQIIYANQLEVVARSNIKAQVKNSYFKGTYYLIEATLNDDTILFEHHSVLDKGHVVFLKIKKHS